MTKWMMDECKRKLSMPPYKMLQCATGNYFYCMAVNSFAELSADDCKSIKELAMKCKPQLEEVRKVSDEWIAGEYEVTPNPTAPCNIIYKSITDLERAADCCDPMKKVYEPFENKACREIPPREEWTCAKMKCQIKLIPGLLKKTGEIDGTAGHQMLDKITKKYPDLASYVGLIDKECFGKNLTIAYPGEKCPSFKLSSCLARTSFMECPSWKESSECAPYKDNAQKCKELKKQALQATCSGESLYALRVHSCVMVATFFFVNTF